MHKNALIIFARNPRFGKVKSRLAATLGKEQALQIYLELLEHTKKSASEVDADRFIFFTNEPTGQEKWPEKKFTNLIQQEGDLGQRMLNALAVILKNGYENTVIIGTDCFELEEIHLQQAFDALEEYDLVLGPAKDGGYYLIGTKKVHKQLFEGIAWSTPEVLLQTVEKARSLGLSRHLLPELSDVDEESDLPKALQ